REIGIPYRKWWPYGDGKGATLKGIAPSHSYVEPSRFSGWPSTRRCSPRFPCAPKRPAPDLVSLCEETCRLLRAARCARGTREPFSAVASNLSVPSELLRTNGASGCP